MPGGAAAYPSTVLMTAVPAQAAGVEQIVVVSPPTPNGAYNPDVLATCHELGIREVYRMGGAQAIAALAYGLDGLVNGPLVKVDKIVGPGNLFVALAKKFVFGDVDIDSIAGPSEVIVIADETTRPDFAAADLIAQAEHAPGSSVLITWSEATLHAVAAELEKQLATIQRGDLARQSLEAFGALILVSGRDEAAELANTLATEHLHIACAEPEEMLSKNSQRRRRVPRAVQPGGAGRLRGRPVARAAHRRDGPLRQRTVVERFSAVAQRDSFHARRLERRRRRCHSHGRTRRTDSARRERGDAARCDSNRN